MGLRSVRWPPFRRARARCSADRRSDRTFRSVRFSAAARGGRAGYVRTPRHRRLREVPRLSGRIRRRRRDRVAAAESIGEELREADLLLPEEAGLRELPEAQQVEHRANAAGGGDLNGAAHAPTHGGRVDLVGVGFLNELAGASAAHRHEDDDDVLEGHRDRVLENVLEQLAAVAQAQIVEQRLHDGRMAGIADGAVIEVPYPARQSLAYGTEATGSVEGLVESPCDRKLPELLERLRLAALAVDDGLARLAILVDDAVRAPGQVVVERVGRKFRQRADAHAHVLQLVEMRREVARDDGDEARGETALGNECRGGARGELLHH